MSSLLFSAVASAQTYPATYPDKPTIWREVTGVDTDASGTPVHTRPHVPAFRTSSDGRVALRVLPNADFTLIVPEQLDVPVRTTAVTRNENSYVMRWDQYKYVNGRTAANNARMFYTPTAGFTGSPGHFTLYDHTSEFARSGEVNNPTYDEVGLEDVYDLKVLCTYDYDDIPENGNRRGKTQLFVTRVTVRVSNPKTVNASISSITAETPVAGPIYNHLAVGREPNIVGDGRLLVMRISKNNLPWRQPVTNQARLTQGVDIVYSYYENGPPADPTKWTDLIPITHAPFDPRINTKFGFAMQPFRDAEGDVIPDGEDLGGTYPWMDRAAKNLFFTTVSDTLRYRVGTSWVNSRYPQAAMPGETLNNSVKETFDDTRGICFAGLWSHGKVVMVDNLCNDMDYAMGDESISGERMVRLFNGSLTAPGNPGGWLRLGWGRVNNNAMMPVGDNRNSTIIDSLENIFNYRKNAVPLTVRDVVWPLHNAKNSDDLAFDDFVDNDAFIVANMCGLTSFDPNASTKTTTNEFVYHSGWENSTRSFSQPVKLQNAATTRRGLRWNVPRFGLVTNDTPATSKGRLEPAATGGIHGKGLWMDGSIGLRFDVPAEQPAATTNGDWYCGLFIDCRHGNDATTRMLVTFPDGTSIRLVGRGEIQYVNATNSVVRQITLPPVNASEFPDLLPNDGWAHLAWQIRNGGRMIDFHLNGLRFHRFSTNLRLFQITPNLPGSLTVGKAANNTTSGLRGWIDDFVLLAHAVDPESACNHAGGTLIGLPQAYVDNPNNRWNDFAARFPDSTHAAIRDTLYNAGETTYSRFANFHDYRRDYGAHLRNIPAGTVSLRRAIHFPEGPLFYNAPRPDSTQNKFCITCHSSSNNGGLTLGALRLDVNTNANADRRRQPSEPFRRLFGRIPVGLVDNTDRPSSQPLAPDTAPPAGRVIDNWMLQPFDGTSAVQTFTLVDVTDPNNPTDITPLRPNGPSIRREPNKAYAIRANLDSAQGTVSLSLNNGIPVTRDRIPYSVNAGSLPLPTYTLTATPGNGGVAASISFGVVD